jgi:hypothetical protein
VHRPIRSARSSRPPTARFALVPMRAASHTPMARISGDRTIGIRGLTRRKHYAPVVGRWAHTFRMPCETREVPTG